MPAVDLATTIDRQRRLREAVAKMGTALAAGEIAPSTIELEALAALCEVYFLPREAARVRRWLAHA